MLTGPSISSENHSERLLNLTSHQDIAPTILQSYLGVTSEIEAYSTGINILTEEKPREWVIAANYNDYAIITEETILLVNDLGQSTLLDKTNRPLNDSESNAKHLQGALEQMSRFVK